MKYFFILSLILVSGSIFLFYVSDDEDINVAPGKLIAVEIIERPSEGAQFLSAEKSGIGNNVVNNKEENCSNILLQNQSDEEVLANKWITENVLIDNAIPEHVYNASMQELMQLAKTQDVSAMFTLGLRYRMLALGSKDINEIKRHVNESERWFWRVAVLGDTQAILEISTTYRLLHEKIQNTQVSEMYKAKYLAYTKLAYQVNEDVAFILTGPNELYKSAKNSLQFDEFYNEVAGQWNSDRNDIGKGFKEYLNVPDYVKSTNKTIAAGCVN